MRPLIPTLSVLALLVAAGCGGGSGSSSPIPTTAPIALATATPSPSPTATAVPLAVRVIGGAPVTATVSQLQAVGRHTLSAQGITNGLPVLVESSGSVAVWAGDIGVWATNMQTQANIPETGLTVTPSGNLPINDPGPQPLSCLSSSTAICVVHPTAWTFGTASTNGKPVGQQTLAVAFADGTSGNTFDYVYDGWQLPCNTGWTYQGGAPVATTTVATSDVYADCVAGNIDFPKGGTLLSAPVADQFGQTITVMPTLLTAPTFATSATVVPMASIGQGAVYAAKTQDGGVAKVYFQEGAGSSAVISASGVSLHAASGANFAF